MKPFLFFFLVALASAALLRLAPGAAAAASCDLMQLSTCAGAIAGNAAPTPACCSKLKAQQASCLCRYRDDPNLKRRLKSKNAKKMFAACKVPIPSC